MLGYEGFYEVSNLGRVKSLSRLIYRKKTNKPLLLKTSFLKSIKTKYGYYVVTLFDENHKRKQIFIHRLVAIAFLENPDNLPFINHKDENRGNNFVCLNFDGTVNNEKSNLEWCTAKYNINYGNCRKKISDAQKKRPVNVYRMNGSFVCRCESVTRASQETNVPKGSISKCLAKKIGYAKGLVFRYVDDNEGNKVENVVTTDRHHRENIGHKRRVRQIGFNGKVMAEYKSIEEAYRVTSVCKNSIYLCCRGKYKTAGGYKWEYA